MKDRRKAAFDSRPTETPSKSIDIWRISKSQTEKPDEAQENEMGKARRRKKIEPASLEGLDEVFSADHRNSALKPIAESAREDELTEPRAENSRELFEAAPLEESSEEIQIEDIFDTGSREEVVSSEIFPRGLEQAETRESNASIAPTEVAAESKGDFAGRDAIVENKEEEKIPPPKLSNVSGGFLKKLIETSTNNLRAARGSASGEAMEEGFVGELDNVSRTDMISLLRGFVRILEKGGSPKEHIKDLEDLSDNKDERRLPTLAPAGSAMVSEADCAVEDKTEELEEMRRLVVEAQETIIKLLTDRVEDRSRIATLETELRLLPDLQTQADRAMAVAFKTEEFRSEMHKIKYELEHYRLANARAQEHRKMAGWMTRVKRWFLKAQGIKQREFIEGKRED